MSHAGAVTDHAQRAQLARRAGSASRRATHRAVGRRLAGYGVRWMLAERWVAPNNVNALTSAMNGSGRRHNTLAAVASDYAPVPCPRRFCWSTGENIDATLGGSVLGRRPAPDERPRWDRLRDYVTAIWEQPVRGLFFLNASTNVPMPFVQALTAIGLRPVLLSGPRGRQDRRRRDCQDARRARRPRQWRRHAQ